MPKFGLIVLLCLAGVMPSLCQSNAPHRAARKLSSPIVAPPSSCGLPIASLGQINGSLAYRRLKYEVEALKLGQEAVESLEHANEDIQKATDITSLLSSMLPATDEAKDLYACAAYVVQIAPSEAENKVFIAILADAYKAESSVVNDLTGHTKEKMLRNDQATKAQQVHDGERSAARTKKQNETATNILEVTTYTLLLSVDLTDKNAKTTEYLTMTCAEKSDLEDAVEELAGKPKSAFTVPATFIKKVLTEHKCRA
jgi:hypothetical protein